MCGIIFSISFKDNLYDQYERLGIETSSAHLCILHRESKLLSTNPWSGADQEIKWIELDSNQIREISEIPHIRTVAPLIQTDGIFSFLDGQEHSWSQINALNPTTLHSIFPGVKIIQGDSAFLYNSHEGDVPLLRRKLEAWEIAKNSNQFVKEDFRVEGKSLDSLCKVMATELLKNGMQDSIIIFDIFLKKLNGTLANPNLINALAIRNSDNSDLRDIANDIQHLISLKPLDTTLLQEKNKQLIATAYSDCIIPSRRNIRAGESMTLSLPLVSQNIETSTILPVKISGFVENMPLFYYNSFIDIEAFRKFADIKSDHYTACYIRLDDKKNVKVVKNALDQYLNKNDLTYEVVDYKRLGKMHMPTAVAFSLCLDIIVYLFCVVISIITANLTFMSLLKRKKEIATEMIIGMSRMHSSMLYMAEMLTVTVAAWIASSVISYALIFFFHVNGLPGMFLFQNNLLFMNFKAEHASFALFITLPFVLGSVILPLLYFGRKQLVTLLVDK